MRDDEQIEEQQTEELDAPEGDAPQPGVDEPEAGEAPFVVQFGDEAPEIDETETAPDWVKELRRQNREQAKRIKELEAGKTAGKAELGQKPTRSDFDYDDDAFDAALEKWYADKARHDADQAESQRAEEAARAAWQTKLDNHAAKKIALASRVPDMDEAEAFVLDVLDATQQGILVNIAADSAVLGYALYKNPSKARELAAERDYILFTKKLTLLETTMNSPRKPPPPADKPVTGNSGTAASVDGELERLREEAARTGDFTKVMAYRRQRAA